MNAVRKTFVAAILTVQICLEHIAVCATMVSFLNLDPTKIVQVKLYYILMLLVELIFP